MSFIYAATLYDSRAEYLRAVVKSYLDHDKHERLSDLAAEIIDSGWLDFDAHLTPDHDDPTDKHALRVLRHHDVVDLLQEILP